MVCIRIVSSDHCPYYIGRNIALSDMSRNAIVLVPFTHVLIFIFAFFVVFINIAIAVAIAIAIVTTVVVIIDFFS